MGIICVLPDKNKKSWNCNGGNRRQLYKFHSLGGNERFTLLLFIISIQNHPSKTKILIPGKTVQITPQDLQPFSEYYKNKIVEYKIITSPFSGFIMAGNSNVKRFTQKQLESGSIQYVHNGSENATDVVSLVAMARNKESVQFDLQISVIPVNDEVPMIVTNTGLQVWNGGVYAIKHSDLSELFYIYKKLYSKILNSSGKRLRHSTREHYLSNSSHLWRIFGL